MTKDDITDFVIDNLDPRVLRRLSDRELTNLITLCSKMYNKGLDIAFRETNSLIDTLLKQ